MVFLDADQVRARLEALSEMEERLSFRITRLSKLLDSHATRQLAGSRLNLTAYRIVMVLNIFKETSAADLARLMVIDRAQVSRSVSELIALGLLTERPDPTNKRRKLLRLTEEGQAELDLVAPHLIRRQKMFNTLLTDDEMAGLSSAIDKLSRYLARELNHPDALPLTEQSKAAASSDAA